MNREAIRAECVKVIGEQRAVKIEQDVIERHRQLHSDDEMWEMLYQREERMASLLKTMGKVGTMLSVGKFGDKEFNMWRSEIDRYSREYAGHVQVLDSLIWHMGKRGLLDPADWREGWQDFLRASALDRYGWPN